MSASPQLLAVRELAARAADLGARAGIGAGPLARRIADATEVIGVRVAVRARRLASDLRRDGRFGSDSAIDPGIAGAERRPGDGA
jgi:hypothetical protein